MCPCTFAAGTLPGVKAPELPPAAVLRAALPWVLAALAEVGVNARYVPLNDIASDAGKIGGAAQKRYPGVVLHHVTMAYDIDANKMVEVLRKLIQRIGYVTKNPAEEASLVKLSNDLIDQLKKGANPVGVIVLIVG